ncbi:MAG: DNA polymerase III subunit delta [Clostridiales bacterium]|nr:DNA polymerase III subunit delta [Clostridiales bacterium]
MKYTELKASIAQGAKSIYLLEGDDAYFRSHGENMIKNAFLTMPELNYSCFDGEALKGSNFTEFASQIKSFPFMAEKRIVKITELHPSESDYEAYLKPVFENFPESTILIIVNSKSKKGAVDFKRKGFITYIDCNKSDEETVTKWVYITFKRAGIVADITACTKIAQYCLCDMSRVSVEVDKLIAYAEGGNISIKDVDALVYKDAEYRIYEMTNAIARKNYSQFCAIAYDLISKGSDEISLLTSLFTYFKNLLIIATSYESDSSLAPVLGMKEYGVKKSREQAEYFGEKKLSFFVNSLYGKISSIKCGEITPDSAFRLSIAEIFFKDI